MDPVSFASSSKLLELRWAREGHRRHRQKVSSIKSSQAPQSEPPPKSFPHLTVRLKKMQQEEERNAEIDRQNRLLVERLSGIISKPSQRLDNWNPYESQQLQIVQKNSERRRRQRALMQDNQIMSSRLLGIRSSYDHNEWEKNYRRHQHIKEMLDSTTKDYSYSTGARRAGGTGSDLDSDRVEHRGRRVPSPMPSSMSSVSDPTETHSKQWRANTKPGKPRQGLQNLYDNEARMLMKVCNKIVQPNEILIKCLVKKPPRQRQAIRVRFRELYDLDLESQLKQSLAKEYRGVVEGLLHNPYLKVVTELHTNVKDIDPFALLTRCTQYDKACLKNLLDVYKKHYSSTLDSDVSDFFGDPDTRELTSAALAGLLSRRPVTSADLDDLSQEAERPFQPEGRLLQGLRTHGPAYLVELEAAGLAPRALDGVEVGGGAGAVYRHLLELTNKRPQVEAITNGLEALMTGDLRELIHLLQLLGESPSVLSEVSYQVEKSRSVSLRELLSARCPGDTGPVVSALLPANSRRAS